MDHYMISYLVSKYLCDLLHQDLPIKKSSPATSHLIYNSILIQMHYRDSMPVSISSYRGMKRSKVC